MSTVVYSIRIKRELREKMKKYKSINWREEVEKFIENKIRELEKQSILEEIDRIVKNLPVSKIPAWKSIREDREKR